MWLTSQEGRWAGKVLDTAVYHQEVIALLLMELQGASAYAEEGKENRERETKE
jgi:hypothetical protein